VATEEVWQARVARERAARREAEQLLESKARELFLRNRELAEAAATLEARVAARTADLETALAAADAAARARLAFLAMVSHELRTPLNAIIGGLDLIGEAPLEEEQRRHLRMIGGSAEALLRIIDDILDLAGLESGKIAVESRPFDAAALLADTMESFRPQAEAKGLALTFDAAGLEPRWMESDAARIRQVLVNLVGNALKFTGQGGVHVAARRLPGPVLALVVEDTGPGLSADDLARLFEPFVRAGRAGRDRLGGTGLGLAICRRIVEALGGSIEAGAATSGGARFAIRLPVRDAAPPAAPAPRQEAPPPRRGHVLVVDDLATNGMVAAAHLRRAGHHVDIAASGAEALSALDSATYDIVFMDLLMPEMDGLETTRAIRAAWGAQPVIVGLTAAGMAAVRADCLAAGMQDVLAKPVTGPKLREAAARWLA
jgi:signal transduction histidine kinase/CheY-like chemotaxis protein